MASDRISNGETQNQAPTDVVLRELQHIDCDRSSAFHVVGCGPITFLLDLAGSLWLVCVEDRRSLVSTKLYGCTEY